MSVIPNTTDCKKCRLCGEDRPLGDYTKHSGTRDGLRRECRACSTKLAAEWRARNPEKVAVQVRRYADRRRIAYQSDPELRKKRSIEGKQRWEGMDPEKKRRQGFRNALITNYGMTVEQYEALLAKQSGLCAICGKQPKKPEVDHDHATGAVRGILCRKCNTGIGLLGDSPEGLVKALTYLRNH